MLGLGYLASCTPPEDERIWDLRSNLESNTLNTERIVTFQSFDEGIEDLENIWDASYYEEFFAYIPEEGMWLEVGGEESFSEGITQVFPDYDFIEGLLIKYDSVFFAHYHPPLPSILEPTGESIEDEGWGEIPFRAEVGNLSLLILGSPNRYDFHAMAGLYAWRKDLVGNGGSLTNYVACGFGLTKYNPSSEIEDFNSLNLWNLSGSQGDYETALMGAWEERPFETFEFENEYITVTHEPF